MLHIQKFLKEHGVNENTVDLLRHDYGIITSFDNSIDQHLINLNYDQITSNKNDALVKECRGIVLNKHTLEVQSRSFSRFFNYGEIDLSFDFNDCSVYEKIDGSLLKISYDSFDNKWKVSTRGTVNARAVFTMNTSQPVPYIKIVCMALGIYVNDINYSIRYQVDKENTPEPLELDAYEAFRVRIHDYLEGVLPSTYDRDNMTIVTELVSPYIASTRKYEDHQLYLLSVLDKKGVDQLDMAKELIELKNKYKQYVFQKPGVYKASGLEQIFSILRDLNADSDVVEEGFVLVDNNTFDRIKIKTDLYMKMHYFISNGVTDKRLVDIYLSNEVDEFIAYYPEYMYGFEKISNRHREVIDEINAYFYQILDAHKSGDSIKTIALKYKDSIYFKDAIQALKSNRIIDADHVFNEYPIKKKYEILFNYPVADIELFKKYIENNCISEYGRGCKIISVNNVY